MKILEAIRWSIPFVTTTIGVEGLDFEHGRHCYIADTGKDFYKSVINLCNDEKQQQIFVENSLLRFTEQYTSSIANKTRSALYQTIYEVR